MPLSYVFRWPLRRQRQAPARIGFLSTAGACGLAAAAVVHLGLPVPVYRAAAFVAADPGGAKPTGEPRRLTEFALSRPVLRFAAADLIGKGGLVPTPGPLERFGLVRLEAAVDRAARLSDQLAATVHAAPSGDGLLIGAEAPDAARAARIATAVAAAFVTKWAEAVSSLQRTREAELSSRIAGAQAGATTARKRFLALGGADGGIAQARTAAAKEVAAADTRVARLRGVLASGSPPISDDVPSSQAVVDQQNTYLDAKGKLAQALETLGERHTTVIELRSSMRRAGADLSAAWTRQLRDAEADRDAAHVREAALGKGDSPGDARKQVALDEARRAKEVADSTLLRAEAELDFLPDQPAFSLRSPAALPTKATDGWFPPARAAAALLAGMAIFWLMLALRSAADRLRRRLGAPLAKTAAPGSLRKSTRRDRDLGRASPMLSAVPPQPARTSAPEAPAPFVSVWNAPLRAGLAPQLPLAPQPPLASRPGAAVAPGAALSEAGAIERRPVAPETAQLVGNERDVRFFRDPPPEEEAHLAGPARPPVVEMIGAGHGKAEQARTIGGGEPVSAESGEGELPDANGAQGDEILENGIQRAEAGLVPAGDEEQAEEAAVRDLKSAFEKILADLVARRPDNGPIPALMVAAIEAAEGTADVALAVGEVAAEAGLRVLVVEASRARPTLAAHAELDDRPALVGMRDGLRIVLRADGIEGLFLAPLFNQRAHLAAALARNAGAPLVENIADTFDLLIIDGGKAARAAAIGWSADSYLCVGGNASIGESERFLLALGNPAGVFAGTVAEATFLPPPQRKRTLRVGPGLRLVASRPQPMPSAVAA